MAVPIWGRQPDRGLVQHIGVVDVTQMDLRIFSRTFSLVELTSFDGKEIHGVEGGSRELVFDVGKEALHAKMKLRG